MLQFTRLLAISGYAIANKLASTAQSGHSEQMFRDPIRNLSRMRVARIHGGGRSVGLFKRTLTHQATTRRCVSGRARGYISGARDIRSNVDACQCKYNNLIQATEATHRTSRTHQSARVCMHTPSQIMSLFRYAQSPY